MLSYEQFMEGLTKLQSFFGKDLTQPQIKLWRERFEKCKPELFELAIDAACDSCKRMPTIAEIKDLMSSNKPQNQSDWKPVPCSFCDGYGFISVWRLTGMYGDVRTQAATRCTCVNGEHLSSTIMRFDNNTMEQV